MHKEKKNYSNRPASTFNKYRSFFQILVCKYFYMVRLKLVYRLKVEGLENVPKDNAYIVCPNHLSTLDPPLIAAVLPRRVSFMAKKELFDIRFLRWWIDWLGAFAVNRESLGPSTIKTVLNIKKSEWVFGIFLRAQGGNRELSPIFQKVLRGLQKLQNVRCCRLELSELMKLKECHFPVRLLSE